MFRLILTLIPNLMPKMFFYLFWKGHFGQFCHYISNVALSVELSKVLDKINIFLSQISTFWKFWKPIWLSIPRGLWPYNFFQDILILRSQNNENIMREKIARIWIAIWGPRSARIKKLKKRDPHFFGKQDQRSTAPPL